ncbi:MAG: hypothetical protein ACXABO_00110 [Promethearchaeota archaeon]
MAVCIKTNKIQVICPVCKTRDIIGIPETRQRKNTHLTTISIHKGLICPHHFQIFLDKNLQIRGYQKVDFELNQDNSVKLRNGVKAFSQKEPKNYEHFESVIFDSKNVKYKPVNSEDYERGDKLKIRRVPKRDDMTLKEIYEDFWEFIDDNNEIFHKFIINDKRRKESLDDSDSIDFYNQLEIDQEI